MHAGATGFKIAEIVSKAAELGIADWHSSASRRNYVYSVCRQAEQAEQFVDVGHCCYALPAFPGVHRRAGLLVGIKYDIYCCLSYLSVSMPMALRLSAPSISTSSELFM